jgi:GntR family transcriptional regulator
LARLFRGRIDRGDWEAGEQLPTEVELADQYGVSRSTIRQALAQLADESYVRREHGKGTFASPPSRLVLTDLSLPLGLAHRSRAQGIGYDTVVRRLAITTPPNAGIASKLRSVEDSPVVEFERAILLNRVPAAISTSWLPADRFGSIAVNGVNANSVSLTLREEFGVELARYENEVEVHDADPERAELLGINATDPLLLLTAVCYSSTQEIVEVSRTYWRTDMVRLRFGLDVAALGASG